MTAAATRVLQESSDNITEALDFPNDPRRKVWKQAVTRAAILLLQQQQRSKAIITNAYILLTCIFSGRKVAWKLEKILPLTVQQPTMKRNMHCCTLQPTELRLVRNLDRCRRCKARRPCLLAARDPLLHKEMHSTWRHIIPLRDGVSDCGAPRGSFASCGSYQLHISCNSAVSMKRKKQ